MSKRLLTDKEIDDIISFIKPRKGIPLKLALKNCEDIRNDISNDLKSEMVYPKIIPSLKKELEKQYYKTQIQPGESVGVLTAQSIGERQTQLTLNTFHKAGLSDKSVTEGVPRSDELLGATKSPKNISCTIYFKNNNSTIDELRNHVGYSIKEHRIKHLVKNIKVNLEKKHEYWYDVFEILYNDRFKKYDYSISLEIKKEIMYEFKISLSKIAERIEEEFIDLTCVFSSNDVAKIDIFIDMDYINNFSQENILYVTQDNKYEIYIEEVVIPNLKELLVCGIEGIENIFYVKNHDEWTIETEGTNFEQILAHPKIDNTRTTSNHVWDIYNTLGIQAAKNMFIKEFMLLMGGINECHAKLLVDMMCHNSTISSISRYTMKKQDAGPLSKASFEEMLDHFVNACFHGDTETTNGVSASIICGKRTKIGTGICELIADFDKLLQS